MIEATEANLRINQGSRFAQPIQVREDGAIKNLTGYTARMQIREFKDSLDTLADLSSEGAGATITIVPATGLVTIDVPGSTTAGYTFGDAWYDLEIVDGTGEPYRILEGRVSLSREVTR